MATQPVSITSVDFDGDRGVITLNDGSSLSFPIPYISAEQLADAADAEPAERGAA
jgi:hypothetical protein